MTSSFGISPQRQIRDLVANPERPAALPEPAAPRATPQQLGGQLMYGATFQKNYQAQEAIKSIQDFLGKEGVFETTSELLFENYKSEKKQQAERILASEATAYRDSLENAAETKQLKAKGDDDLARQNQLSNPWVNYFYYDTKATNAGKEVAIGLASWGKKSAERLAELPVDQRAAAMAAKAQELMQPYADVPEAFRAAKIDPLVSATLFDLKKDVVNKSYERTVSTDQNTAIQKFYGGLKVGAQFMTASLGAKEGTVLGQKGVQQGYDDARAFFVDVRGYSEKEFHELLFREGPRLFIDVDGDKYNDIGDAYGFRNIVASFDGIKTKDGQNILDLRNDKGQTFREVLEVGAVQAVKRSESFAAAEERTITRAQRNWRRDLANESQGFYSRFGNPTDDQIVAQRQALKARNRQLAAQGLLPEGMSVADADEVVDKAYPFQNKDISPEQSALLELEAKELINSGTTQMPAELRARAEGTPIFGKLVTMFGNAAITQSSAGYKEAQGTILKGLLDGLSGSFMQDPAIKAMASEKGEIPKQKKSYLNQAIIEAKIRLKAEGSAYIRSELNKAAARGENVNDPAVQLGILERAKSYFFQRPEYNDVDQYYNVTETGKLGQRNTRGPALGSSTKNAQGQWVININDSDNRASWAAVAAPVFRNNPKAARQYLSERFVFNQTELGEINAALSTGDLSRLSASTRRSLANVQRGFGNQITAAEILQKQANRYFDGATPPVFRENALKIQGAIRVAAGGGGTKPVDASLIITDRGHSHSKRPGGSGNNAIDVTIQRQNGQISNPVPAPFSGTIVSSGYERGGFGNSIIIRADSDGPGYRKGDLVRLAHLAAVYYREGQRIRRGMPIGKSGDSSRHDSRPGYSGTGAGDPGHVHIQLYRPGGATQQYQYGQETQYNFIRKAYSPLFRSSQ